MIHVVDTFQRLIINQIHRDCLSPWQIYSLRDWGGNWGSEVTKRSEMTIEGLRWQKGDSWGSEVTKGSEVTIEDLKWQRGLRWQLRVWSGLWEPVKSCWQQSTKCWIQPQPWCPYIQNELLTSRARYQLPPPFQLFCLVQRSAKESTKFLWVHVQVSVTGGEKKALAWTSVRFSCFSHRSKFSCSCVVGSNNFPNFTTPSPLRYPHSETVSYFIHPWINPLMIY